MTRAEIRIAAAQKKERAARLRLSALEEGRVDAIRNVSLKWRKLIWPAEKAVREANAALTIAKLAGIGIKPEHTIVAFKGAFYAVRITRLGWDKFVPVTKDGREHLGKNPVRSPYRWDGVTVTDRVMKK